MIHDADTTRLEAHDRRRAISLLASRSHKTELPTAAHVNQSPTLNAVVENACCRNGAYTTAACRTSATKTASHSHLLENAPTNALCSSERALKTVNREKSTKVVNAMVCA